MKMNLSKRSRRHEQHFLFSVFCAIILVGVIAAFYRSAFRQRVEDKLFDIRTRLIPSSSTLPDTVVVSITDTFIERSTGKAGGDLSYRGLQSLIDSALVGKPAAIFVNLYPQIFPYGDPALNSLVEKYNLEPVYYGLFGITDLTSATSLLPAYLQTVADRVYYADTLPEYRRAVLRTLPVKQPKDESTPLFMTFVAKTFRPSVLKRLENAANVVVQRDEIDYSYVRLNYDGLSAIKEIAAENLVAQRQDALDAIAKRYVVIGYRPFRTWSTQPSLVNGPWQNDGADLKEGIPLTLAQGIGIQNILNTSFLEPLPVYVNVIQTILVTILSVLVWRMRSGYAATAFVVMWVSLLIGHSLLFSFAAKFLELSDTAIFSSLGLISGSLWRMREEGRLRAVEEAKAESNRQVAYLQSRYLDELALELNSVNRSIIQNLDPIKACVDPDVQKIFRQATASNEELREYLVGIEQLAEIDAKALQKVVRRPVGIKPVLERIIRRFDFRMHEEGIALELDCPEETQVLADEMLLEQVIYNLLSNAIKYSPRHTKVVVSVRGGAKAVKLEVVDQGPGISLEFQEKIFEKFYRVKDDFVLRTKGHGLGLYLSRYFASSMGAAISVRSETGKGSTFELTLSRAKV